MAYVLFNFLIAVAAFFGVAWSVYDAWQRQKALNIYLEASDRAKELGIGCPFIPINAIKKEIKADRDPWKLFPRILRPHRPGDRQ